MGILGSSLLLIAVAAVVVFGIIVVLFRSMWRVAEPNEALVISGIHHSEKSDDSDGLGFKVVTGHGAFVIPGIQTVRRLSLDLHESELDVKCVTTQGIAVGVKGVVIYKVADDKGSIANAARRFLDQQNKMDMQIQNVFTGHLRSVVGSLTMEELIRDREKLTQEVRDASGTEMTKLGLTVDSLLIQDIEDPTGYIQNLAAPHQAQITKDARVAAAIADQIATQQEQESAATKAQAQRDSQIKQAGYKAEIEAAKAKSEQAGPLANATAKQEVIVQETAAAQLEAQRREQQLQIEVRKPADADAYAVTVRANAARDAAIATAEGDAQRVKLSAAAAAESTRITGIAEASATQVKGEAEGKAIEAKGLAQAAATKAQAEALATNNSAVIGLRIAEQLPLIVGAAAKPFESIKNLTVLNGAEGMSEMLTQIIGTGMAGLNVLRNAMPTDSPVTKAMDHVTNGLSASTSGKE
ncbi:MAG: flotillin family protein [Vulcanimicrobiaceae bacterium]